MHQTAHKFCLKKWGLGQVYSPILSQWIFYISKYFLPTFFFTVKNENIYEEIQEVRQDSSSGSNTDSGIGVTKSFTSSAGSSSMPCSKGTLDVKKKVQQQSHNHKPPREPVKPMSSLDALLCQTTLTADQRWSQ